MARKKVKDQTTDYAKKVVAGKIIAGKFVRLACQRHLDDLKQGPARGLKWDPARAEEVIRFFPEMLTISEGEHEGEPFNLLWWMIFVVGSVFGWLDKNGRRRFRVVWIETGKGQAKSPLMAAIGLFMLSFCDIAQADIYCIGEDKNTARVVFKDAVAMATGPIPDYDGETLESIGRLKVRGTGKLAYQIEYLAGGGSMQPIANTDSKSGPKPSAVFADEVHEMKKSTGIQTWLDAITKMSGDPLMILGTNTPSQDQTTGTHYSNMFQRVLTGETPDDSMFAYIARVDEEDDPFTDESCWIKSLPALGVTYPIENIRKRVVSAEYDISGRIGLERLYFGIPVGSAGFWMDESSWDNARGPVNPDDYKHRRCHLALDLSEKNDLTALSATWEPTDEESVMPVKTWYWTCETGLGKRTAQDRIPFRELERAGEITIVKARKIDFKFVAAQVQQLYAGHDVVQMVCDSAYIDDFMDACTEIGFSVWMFEDADEPPGVGMRIVRHRQGGQIAFPKVDQKTGKTKAANWLDMPHSIQKLIDGILGEEIIIDEGRLNTYCAANAVLKAGPMDNKYFDKSRSKGRIDGIVTAAMVIGSAKSDKSARSSVYEKRGIRTL